MQVISPSEDLQVVTIRHKVFYNFIDLFRFLWLSSPLTEDDVAVNSVAHKVFEVTFVANETGLLCMLQVVSMTLGNLAIDSLLDPYDFINKSILQRKS